MSISSLSDSGKLILIKIIHTLVWVFFNAIIFYLLYAVLSDKIDEWFWWGWGFILLESFILLIFRMSCPLTLMARKYSDSNRSNFDIFLPEWLAKYNKQIYSAILILIILILVYRLAT